MKIKQFNKELPFKAPTRGSAFSAGYDLYYAGSPVMIEPMQRMILPTNTAIEIPEGHYGRVAPRSGLAAKNGIDVLAGVIDSDYRDEIKVILINLGNKAVSFSTGDRIAQIIFERHYNFEIEVVEELSQTDRGLGGLGSTGK